MPGIRRALRAGSASLAVAASLASAGSALAGTVQTEPGNGLVFRAAPGETNDVVVRDHERETRSVVDTGAPLTVGPECVVGTPTVCTDGPGALYLGNRDDRGRMFSFFRVGLIYGEGGDDTIHSDGVHAYGYGGPGDDVVGVSAHVGYAYGGTGNDEVTGGAGDYNEVHGDGGDDLVRQGTIAKCADLYGDSGNDRLLGHAAGCIGPGVIPDQFGGTGADALIVASGPEIGSPWRLDGGGGDDYIVGGRSSDHFVGGTGADFIHAAVDGVADTIECGSGRDVVRADPLDTVAADCEQVTVVG